MLTLLGVLALAVTAVAFTLRNRSPFLYWGAAMLVTSGLMLAAFLRMHGPPGVGLVGLIALPVLAAFGVVRPLRVDIVAGQIDTVHFPNGGWLSVLAPIDESGAASEADSNGRLWEFSLNMNTAAVENGAREWADANGYALRP